MRKIDFSLIYRDMWQSSGKYQPRKEELCAIAPVFNDMGCLKRVETNGGGFEQVTLLFGDNPNHAVRAYTEILHQGGIQCHMLERALNGIRMYPVPADVRRLFFKVKNAQGVDISRSFCGLNDVRNLENSIKFAKEAGVISQACLSLTYSKVHTAQYYLKVADALIEMGADEICIKDMAGVGRPHQIGLIVSGIKKRHPKTYIQYHNHAGPGLAPASIIQAVQAGADCVDVGMEPLSWGTGATDILTAVEILRDIPGLEVPEVNMPAYMKARELTQGFIDDWLGYYINPKNRYMNSLLLKPGLPGGMMGSLMGWVEEANTRINKWAKKNNKPTCTLDQVLIMLFDEVAKAWPEMGYPPLVTPFSQYVAVTALNNVELGIKGEPRYSRVDEKTWGMLTGKSGMLPGAVSEILVELANKNGYEFFEGNPQSLYPDKLDEFKEEMKKNDWAFGPDDEELFELAMHPEQYRDFKSGRAAENFEKELAKKRQEKQAKAPAPAGQTAAPISLVPTKAMIIVNGKHVLTEVVPIVEAAGAMPVFPSAQQGALASAAPQPEEEKIEGTPVLAIQGTVRKVSCKPGATVKKGETLFVIEAMKVENQLTSPADGVITNVFVQENDAVEEDDVIATIG